ncbi:MAG: Uma2 family endonuclease [Chloroflexia bacterium]
MSIEGKPAAMTTTVYSQSNIQDGVLPGSRRYGTQERRTEASEMATTTRPAGGWTYEDLQRLPDDGKRYEIIEGELFEMPAPSYADQFASNMLHLLIAPAAIGLGQVALYSPLDLMLESGGNPVQPDLLVLASAGDDPTGAHIRGVVPTFVVEILSPSNPAHDLVRKRRLYELAGVPVYWIVSPEARIVEVLTLEGGEYKTHVRAGGHESVTSKALPSLTFAASAVFA